MDDQLDIVNVKNHEKIGKIYTVLVEDYDGYTDSYSGRTYMDAPEIDGKICFTTDNHYNNGDFVRPLEVLWINRHLGKRYGSRSGR
jgi:ribosomal protein S12 methylthiotransferase